MQSLIEPIFQRRIVYVVAEVLFAADISRGTLAIREALIQATATSGALLDFLKRVYAQR